LPFSTAFWDVLSLPSLFPPAGQFSSWENEAYPMNAASPERKPSTEQISGLIERVTFHNDQSGFCVLRVKVQGQRDELTVVGSLPSVLTKNSIRGE